MIQLKNTTDKQTFHIPRTVMKTEFVSGTEAKDVSITENGTYQILPSKGKKALSAVNIDISILPTLQTKNVEYDGNGNYSVTPDEGFDGLSEVNVTVECDFSKVPFKVPSTLKFGNSTIDRFPDNWDWSAFENIWVCSELFSGCAYLKEIPKLRLNGVREMSYTFKDCVRLSEIDTSEWNTSSLSHLNGAFYNSGFVENPQIDTSNVIYMTSAFEGCSRLKRVKNLNTSKVTSLNTLFGECYYLESIDELDASSISSNSYSYSSPIYRCYLLRHFGGLKGIKYNWYADTAYSLSYESLLNIINGLADGVSGKTLYLYQDLVNQLSDEDIAIATNKGWSISPAKSITSPIVVTSMSDLNWSVYHITPKNYDFSQYTGSWVSGAYSAIPSQSSLCVFEGDISGTINASQMFRGCSRLGYVTLYNTGNITDMTSMLSGCTDLVEVNFKDWDVSNVTTMTYMFHNVCNLDLDFSNWDVSKVTNFEYMFYQSEIKDVDMSNWKHSSNARMKNMFSNSEVENVIFGDISNVYNMDSIFIGCHNLKSVTMTHPINSNLSNYSMFSNVTSEGTFYYNPQYDYSKVIAELPETWTAIPLE